MSNQVYYESYTCSCVRKHPKEEVFVAQSAANYIAIFQSTKPYRMNRRKVCFVIPYPLPALRKSQSERVQDRNVLFARRRIACHRLRRWLLVLLRLSDLASDECDSRVSQERVHVRRISSTPLEHRRHQQLGRKDRHPAIPFLFKQTNESVK